MPTATRPHRPRGRRRRAEEIAEEENNQLQPELSDPPLPETEKSGKAIFDPFLPESQDGIAFTDVIAMITEAEWQNYWLYLYRLDPKVRNAEADHKYLARYQMSVNEDDIKQEHGGGKYMFILKENVSKEDLQELGLKPRQRRYYFSIEGAPKYLRGQTIVANENGDAPAPPAPPESEGATLARMLPDILRQRDSRPSDAGVNEVSRMIGEAARGAIQIVTESTRQQVTSITGSAFGDRLLDRFLDDKQPKRSSIEDQLINLALERLKNPEPPASSDGGLGQLTVVKELLGVDSILDLVKGGVSGGDSWKGKLVDTLSTFIQNAPNLFQLYLQMQQLNLQRAMAMRAQPVIQGQPQPAGPAGPVIPAGHIPAAPGGAAMPQTEPAAPHPGEFPGGMMPVAMDPTAQALMDIVACFDAGLGGDAAASLLQTKYPQFVAMFVPLLSDRNQVTLFAQNTPPLNQIAGDDEFPEFLDQFIQEMLKPDDGPLPEDPRPTAAA